MVFYPAITDEIAAEAVAALLEHGSGKKAALALGIARSTFQNRLLRAAQRGLDGSVPKAIPPGQRVKGVSTLYNSATGEPIVQWVKTKDDECSEDVLARIRAGLEGMAPAFPVAPPDFVLPDLCTVYPIADAHLGLMAWGRETGTDYDTAIASERITNWVAQCVAASPASATSIIMDVGDYTHADNDTNQTPQSKHVLDVDTRIFRTLDVGIETLSASIGSALTKHADVHVVILPGNHNSTIYLALLFALAERYRDDPRVHVHKKPGEFFLHEFGRVLIAAHHGDKAKADRLVHFVADEFAEAWGRTKHRFLFTGHLHSHKSQDIGGMKWEQLRAVTERDAYAYSHAYTARAQLQAITYHRTRGEIQRVAVNAQ